MSRYLLIAAAGVATLALAGPAYAHGPSRSYGSSHVNVYHGGPSYSYSTGRTPVSTYGTKFSHGYYFGRNNFYWNQRYWSNRYGCYCYWNPYAPGWYYWYAPGNCYYPLSYISYAPPTVVVTPPIGPTVPGSAMPPAGPPAP